MDIHKDELTESKTIDEYMDYVRIPEDTRDRLMKDYSHGTKNKMQMLLNIISTDILRKQKDGRVLIFSTHLLDIAVDLCDEIVLLNHGKLEPVSRENLDNSDFKERIIEALKDADDT